MTPTNTQVLADQAAARRVRNAALAGLDAGKPIVAFVVPIGAWGFTANYLDVTGFGWRARRAYSGGESRAFIENAEPDVVVFDAWRLVPADAS